jgi:hypothetical protein
MDFKKLPYWFKGGFFLLFAYILIAFIAFLFNDEKGILFGLANFPMIELVRIIWLPGTISNNLRGFIWVLFSSIFWFLIGSFIGWIAGRIKFK